MKKGGRHTVSDIAELSRWKLSLAVAFSAVTGYMLCAGEEPRGVVIAGAGVFLLSAGASALNQFTERRSDALMERTAGRPLPSGRMAPPAAMVAAVILLAAGIVLALMIFPTISNVAADSIHSVPKDYRMAAYGLGSTRWQSIYKVVIPAAGSGILSGIILGLARAFGEALAVAMVIGQTTALPKGLFSTTKSLTTEIAAQMGNATEGGEMKTALWTMALLLFLLSLLFILLIHYFSRPKKDKE